MSVFYFDDETMLFVSLPLEDQKIWLATIFECESGFLYLPFARNKDAFWHSIFAQKSVQVLDWCYRLSNEALQF